MAKVKRLEQKAPEATLRFVTGDEPLAERNAPMLDVETRIRRSFAHSAEEGMATLFELYYPVLCSHAVRFVASKTIAEDIVSDIFYDFHLQQRYLHITSSFRAFLFTAVRHRAFDHLRTELRRGTSLEQAPFSLVSPPQQPDSIVQFEELYHDFQKVIGEMPLKRRQIYLLHRFEGKKYQDIAQELGLSVRTVEAHLYQAVRQIRLALQDKWLVWWVLLTLSG